MGERFDKWTISKGDSDYLERSLGMETMPEPLRFILEQRGLTNVADLEQFLYPQLSSLPAPEAMMGVEKSASLVCEAKETGRRVVIFGDYDVDGVTSTALLFCFLEKIGVDVAYYHPDRLQDGYSLSSQLVRRIAEENPGCLLVTVDCGISDEQPVLLAKKLGLDVIITDHHLPPQQLPKADAIINPLQPGCLFPQKNLAGVGLAFYLLVGIRARLRCLGVWNLENQPNLKDELDFVAIGTVADMVPLQGVNRVFVSVGLDLLNSENCNRVGIQALLDTCGFESQEIGTEEIGYQLGPRINAAGRLKNARLATDLFVCSSKKTATGLVAVLESINQERKKMASELTAKAILLAIKQVEEGRVSLVLHGANWHHGLLGIVASRLIEQFKRPTIVLGGSPIAKGSGRTIPSIDLYETLKRCENHLVQFGGHRQAAGLTIAQESIADFSAVFEKVVSENFIKERISELLVDAMLSSDVEIEGFFEKYRMLRPFGVGNPEPKFTLNEPCYLRNIVNIGKDKSHLKFSVMVLGRWLSAIGFGFGGNVEAMQSNKVNIVFSIRDNWFRGKKTIQVYVHDLSICN